MINQIALHVPKAATNLTLSHTRTTTLLNVIEAAKKISTQSSSAAQKDSNQLTALKIVYEESPDAQLSLRLPSSSMSSPVGILSGIFQGHPLMLTGSAIHTSAILELCCQVDQALSALDSSVNTTASSSATASATTQHAGRLSVLVRHGMPCYKQPRSFLHS